MILHARWQGAHDSRRPVLVWLHGFLGNSEEWRPVQRFFRDWPQLSIDLPGHGGSSAQPVSGFDGLSQRLNATLQSHRVKRYWLIGYSLGGRIASYHACRHADSSLAGVIVEGAHPGLASDEAKAARLALDREWARLFCQQPLPKTLAQWYRQPLFAGLSEQQRQQMIALRASNNPQALAAMLLTTSLAGQPNLLPEIRQLNHFHYLCGEHDDKFRQLAVQASLPLTLVPAAGHNAHHANPQAFAQLLACRLEIQKEK